MVKSMNKLGSMLELGGQEDEDQKPLNLSAFNM